MCRQFRFPILLVVFVLMAGCAAPPETIKKSGNNPACFSHPNPGRTAHIRIPLHAAICKNRGARLYPRPGGSRLLDDRTPAARFS